MIDGAMCSRTSVQVTPFPKSWTDVDIRADLFPILYDDLQKAATTLAAVVLAHHVGGYF